MSRETLSKAILAAATLAGMVGVWLELYDTPLLVLSIAAIGVFFAPRRWWILAGVFLTLGLAWSSLHPLRCSVWGRGNVVVGKLGGDFQYVSWGNVLRNMTAPCLNPSVASDMLPEATVLTTERLNGQDFTLYGTNRGEYWVASHDQTSIPWIIWELYDEDVYQSEGVQIQPGDIVIDCGAHIGAFSRFALEQGAGKVIAIEPDPTNLLCLKRNLASGIEEGRVVVFEGGVWDEPDVLNLWTSDENTPASSFFHNTADAKSVEAPVLPLDDILRNLGIEQVDFIKMDIEGSERRALRGAVNTLREFHPRMAICAYHAEQDPAVIPQIRVRDTEVKREGGGNAGGLI